MFDLLHHLFSKLVLKLNVSDQPNWNFILWILLLVLIICVQAFLLGQGGPLRYSSTEELLQAIRKLAADLEAQGKLEVAKELREGISLLNGLTDGWVLLMESIERIVRNQKELLEKKDLAELKALLREVHKIVYRA